MWKTAGNFGIVLCLQALLTTACATGGPLGGESMAGDYLTLRTEGATWQMRIEPSGRVFGANFELQATETGYRGLANGSVASLDTTDGSRVVGTRNGQPIDLHVTEDGETILATGLYAGALGRLEVAARSITSSVGPCTVTLALETERRYVGKRICRGTARFRQASIELPQAWQQLSTPRKVMLLATLMGA